MGQYQSNLAPQQPHQQSPHPPTCTRNQDQRFQQPSTTPNPAHKGFQQTEMEPYQPPRQTQKRKRQEDAEQDSKSMLFSQPLNANQESASSPMTINPMQLSKRPAAMRAAQGQVQNMGMGMGDAAQMQQRQRTHMSGHGHPHFPIPAPSNYAPQQQQQMFWQPLHQHPHPYGNYTLPHGIHSPGHHHPGHHYPPQPFPAARNSFAGLQAVQGTPSSSDPPLHHFTPQEKASLNKTYTNPDLDSASQTEQPDFHFPISDIFDPPALSLARPGLYETSPFPGPVTLLHTPDVAQFCCIMKRFLHDMFGNSWFGRPGILRMECLDLCELEKGREGYVLLAEEACRISFPVKKGETEEARLNKYGRKWLNATLFAILTPKEGRGIRKQGPGGSKSAPLWEKDVRFFWCVLPVSPVLKMLSRYDLSVVNDFQPGTPRHRRLTTWLRESFLKAVTISESDDYKNAMQETDCCPDIIDHDNALKRLHANEWLHNVSKDPEHGKDLSDDRYLLKLHPAERESASLAHLKCAEYLLTKRMFFKSFYEEIYRSEKDIDPLASNTVSGRGVRPQPPQQVRRAATSNLDEADYREDTPMSNITRTPARGATPAATTASVHSQRGTRGATARRVRVRTDHAHQRWLELNYEMKHRRAKSLVICWKEFGFLDESRYLDWRRAGGMFEDAEVEEE